MKPNYNGILTTSSTLNYSNTNVRRGILGGFNFGDMLVQLVFLGIIILIILVIIGLIRSSIERRKQIWRMEEKINSLTKHDPKD